MKNTVKQIELNKITATPKNKSGWAVASKAYKSSEMKTALIL